MVVANRSEVLGLLRSGKWVVLLVLLVLLSVGFARASSWQYDRAMAQVDAQRAAAAKQQPIGDLVRDGSQVPTESLGRLAVVHGDYVADAWVVNRASPDGTAGVWLLSAIDDGSGMLTAVLRGWLPAKTGGSGHGAEGVTVIGRVSSPENFYTRAAPPAPDELVAITAENLAAMWHAPLRAGYVVLSEQVPGLASRDPVPVPAVFGGATAVGFPWQNAGYAAQWLVFIAFAGFMFLRMFRDDLQLRRELAGAVEAMPVAGGP